MKGLLSIAVFSLLLLISSCDGSSDDPLVSCADVAISVSIDQTISASACGAADGELVVSASGGTPPYQYSIGTEVNTTGLFSNLPAGIYSITVTDKNGCQKVKGNISLNAVGLSFNSAVVEDTECHGGNGSVTINVLEGAPPYRFSLDGGPFQEENRFAGLNRGNYNIVLEDASGCRSDFSIHIAQGNTGISWESDIKPIIQRSCVSGCHNGAVRQDLRIYDKAKFYASQMKSLTATRSMPFEGTITQREIDLIGCWVDEGAREN